MSEFTNLFGESIYYLSIREHTWFIPLSLFEIIMTLMTL
jgi:hypothetical protein